MRTPEQRKAYNDAYCARPEVIERKRILNAQPHRKAQRRAYKKTQAGRQANRKSRLKHWEVHKPSNRDRHLQTRYGITAEMYAAMLAAQQGQCAICKSIPDGLLHVDHCHETERVRGLLCGNCNRALGLFKDNIKSLEEAITYLKCLH
jgi:hypothetical protein